MGKVARGSSPHQYSASAAYANPDRIDVSVTTRFVGGRYDDDLNSLALDPFYVTDLRIARRLNARTRVVGSVENLFDRQYSVSRTPSLVRVGGPRFLEGGVQYAW